MNLRRLTKFSELTKMAPLLGELHAGLEGKWEPDSTSEEFLQALIENFEEDAYYFGDCGADGKLIYFAVLLRQTRTKALFWLFYMNKAHRDLTKDIIGQLKIFMGQQGFTTVYTQSTRTSSSYERWLEKFGAEKVAIVYKFNT